MEWSTTSSSVTSPAFGSAASEARRLAPPAENHGGTGSAHKFEGTTNNLADSAKIYAYRHPSYTMNMSFLDGHAENLGNMESRQVDFFFPTGTIITATGLIEDQRTENGDLKAGYVVK